MTCPVQVGTLIPWGRESNTFLFFRLESYYILELLQNYRFQLQGMSQIEVSTHSRQKLGGVLVNESVMTKEDNTNW